MRVKNFGCERMNMAENCCLGLSSATTLTVLGSVFRDRRRRGGRKPSGTCEGLDTWHVGVAPMTRKRRDGISGLQAEFF